MSNDVTIFFERQNDLIRHLLEVQELSLAQDAEEMLQKNLPLAAASYFEYHICEILRSFVKSKSGGCVELHSLIESTAIKRQYHAMFDWEGKNVNRFLSLFGPDFKDKISAEIAADADLTEASKNFLEIGQLRNFIVHKNYTTYRTEKSTAEIFLAFKKALNLIKYLHRTFQ